jgi:hypothetical protein
MESVLSAVGWDSLTSQGIRFGIATILALLTLSPGRSSGRLNLQHRGWHHGGAGGLACPLTFVRSSHPRSPFCNKQ